MVPRRHRISARSLRRPLSCVTALLFAPALLPAADYEVGPSAPYKSISALPWQSLAPGDHVRIHWRPEHYREKWVIACRGTEKAPIVVSGVPGPHGEQPVIDGSGAVKAAKLDFWGAERSALKIGGAEWAKTGPAYLVVENLDICNARPPLTYIDAKGVQPYQMHAAPLWIESGQHILIRHCTIHDGANGLFVSHDAKDVVIESCWLHDNGMEKNIFTHSIYSEADGILFQYNHLGKLRPGCAGNNLKDRSAGLVVRYNWIEGGNRELDLVDAEDSAALRSSPSYRQTFVYGNVIIEPVADGNNQIVHYGGDSDKPDWYRKGVLYFYNNTVLSYRTDYTTLFALSTNDEQVDARNNIIYIAAGGARLGILDVPGQASLTHNWISRGWVPTHGRLAGSLKDAGNLAGADPGFVSLPEDDFHLTAASPCRGAGSPLAPGCPPVTRQYRLDQLGMPRTDAGRDLGAFGTDASR